MITHPFAPVFDEHSEILILGSFPSVKSRENEFYYGHPQNRFWKVLEAVFEGEGNSTAHAANTAAGPGNYVAGTGNSTAGPGNYAACPGNSAACPANSAACPGNYIASSGNSTAREGNYIACPGNSTTREGNSTFSLSRATISEKKTFLLQHHIALWDVIASCEIKGSADVTITNATPNDIASLLKKASIRKIYCNGNKVWELYKKYVEPQTARAAIKLPSTSPANAAWSLEKLITEWKKNLF